MITDPAGTSHPTATPPPTAEIYDVLGAVNTGSGPQVNLWLRVSDSADYRESSSAWRAANPQAVPDDHVRWLQDRFVAPPEFDRAQRVLAERRALVLSGPAGAGRLTAATMLLCPAEGPPKPLLRLPIEAESPDSAELPGPEQVSDGDGLLLDLSGVDRDLLRRHLRQLSAFRAAIQDTDTRLVVVLSTDQSERLPADLHALRVSITAPTASTVLLRHLRDLPDPLRSDCARLIRDGQLGLDLAALPMDTVARFAHFVNEAAAGRSGRLGAAACFRDASAALHQHADTITELANGEHANGPSRALLLSAAMLEGAGVDAVHNAEQALLTLTRHPVEPLPALEHPDVFDRLRKLHAEVDLRRRVRFPALGFADAVRAHFWDRYPLLRRQFVIWVRKTVTLSGLTAADRDRVTDRFAEQCLRVGYVDELFSVAKAWAAQDDRRIRRLVPALLSRAVTHDRLAGVAHAMLYDWARQQRLDVELARILIAVCVDTLGPAYPEQAAVRLRWLTRHSDPRIAAEARGALTELAAAPRVLRRALATLTRTGEIDLDLFVALADPHRLSDRSRVRALIDETDVRANLALGWQKLLTDRGYSFRAWPLVSRWLEACTAATPSRRKLLQVLISGCAGHLVCFARLFDLTRAWAAAAPLSEKSERSKVAALIADLIDQERGLLRPPAVRETDEGMQETR